MVEYQGIGLAAPQVHESVRLFVAGVRRADVVTPMTDDIEMPFVTVINPEIVTLPSPSEPGWEGCLSIPDIRGRVPRAREIKVRALDRHGERIELHARDYPARVIQHETDHLDGILFFDRMRSFETLTFLEEYGRYWTRED
jgi:peptide deformylase